MYTVRGSGRHCNLTASILRDLGEDERKATSLSIENTVSAFPAPYQHKMSCGARITIKIGLWKELNAQLLQSLILPTIHHLSELNCKIQAPLGIQITGSMMRDILFLKANIIKLLCRTKADSYSTKEDVSLKRAQHKSAKTGPFFLSASFGNPILSFGA